MSPPPPPLFVTFLFFYAIVSSCRVVVEALLFGLIIKETLLKRDAKADRLINHGKTPLRIIDQPQRLLCSLSTRSTVYHGHSAMNLEVANAILRQKGIPIEMARQFKVNRIFFFGRICLVYIPCPLLSQACGRQSTIA